jgi:hypothetical protein
MVIIILIIIIIIIITITVTHNRIKYTNVTKCESFYTFLTF